MEQLFIQQNIYQSVWYFYTLMFVNKYVDFQPISAYNVLFVGLSHMTLYSKHNTHNRFRTIKQFYEGVIEYLRQLMVGRLLKYRSNIFYFDNFIQRIAFTDDSGKLISIIEVKSLRVWDYILK